MFFHILNTLPPQLISKRVFFDLNNVSKRIIERSKFQSEIEKKHQSKSIDKHTIVVEKKTNLILLILVFFCFDQNYDEKTITSELLFSGAFKYHSKKKTGIIKHFNF